VWLCRKGRLVVRIYGLHTLTLYRRNIDASLLHSCQQSTNLAPDRLRLRGACRMSGEIHVDVSNFELSVVCESRLIHSEECMSGQPIYFQKLQSRIGIVVLYSKLIQEPSTEMIVFVERIC
jgi:hypothetical protein